MYNDNFNQIHNHLTPESQLLAPGHNQMQDLLKDLTFDQMNLFGDDMRQDYSIEDEPFRLFSGTILSPRMNFDQSGPAPSRFQNNTNQEWDTIVNNPLFATNSYQGLRDEIIHVEQQNQELSSHFQPLDYRLFLNESDQFYPNSMPQSD